MQNIKYYFNFLKVKIIKVKNNNTIKNKINEVHNDREVVTINEVHIEEI